MKLEIKKMKKENIFNSDFNNLRSNNIIDFNKNNVIIYAPNGVGKSSLCNVFAGNGEYIISYNNVKYTEANSDFFHVINDQNNRNIIKGETSDFLVGDNIAREYELKKWLDDEYSNLFENLKKDLKKEYGISKQSDEKINWINKENRELVKKIAKGNSKKEDIDLGVFYESLSGISIGSIEEDDSNKLNFLINNTSIINELFNIDALIQNAEIKKIEENNDAIKILKKYNTSLTCIVCDNEEINSIKLLTYKENKTNSIISNLDENTKNILENIIEKICENDPFKIKENLTNAIINDEIELVDQLKNELNRYKQIYMQKVLKRMSNCINSEFKANYLQYKKILNSPLIISDEDILYIQAFIEDSISKNIKIERQDNKLMILLNDQEFINIDREELPLSSGEQNFISLTFELLKAKNSAATIIVIDDPISSFDSIFKNKLTYAIVKFLENKKTIITTHNTDLLRLFEVQKKDNFNLYLFNNYENQENGYVYIEKDEREILIFIPELLKLLRSNKFDTNIKNYELFVYSLIPFMRGLVNLLGNASQKNELTKLMHGYNTECIDLANIYNKLFNKDIKIVTCVSVSNILNLDINIIDEIIDKVKYPLFNRVLVNNLKYLYLRLKTEKVLVDKYNIDTTRCQMLTQIINKSFIEDTDINKKNRIFFFSKKTLLNEFNHFDGNMNIFQPAIDISEQILKKEKNDILEKLDELKNS